MIRLSIGLVFLLALNVGRAQEVNQISRSAPDGYPDGVREIRYLSSADDSEQPALFWEPQGNESGKRPLLVALHTWSHDYRQAGNEVPYAEWCQKAGWIFIHPNFRGSNRRPEAMGSELVVADILSAVEYARSEADVDESRIYCIGVSGGGHASLLMAGRAPELWAGVSAWCGISDIAAWHQQCDGTAQQRYANNIEAALGGKPDTAARLAEASRRSPNNWLAKAGGVALDINHGVHDGRTGSVPFSHSLHAWNEVVTPNHSESAIPDESIKDFYQSQQSFEPAPAHDPLYPKEQQPVFRRIAGTTRVTIFEGGHEILQEAALNWLAAQQKGKPVAWQADQVHSLEVKAADRESGK
tara:strand:- start:1159 stop:2226 length:1068 start_codon:yes stop_codon:yes gene_type:complete